MNREPAEEANPVDAPLDAHEAWSLRLAASLDGELDAAGQAELDDHLRDCPRCRGEVRAQRVVRARLAREPRLQASRRLRERVQALAPPAATGRRRWRLPGWPTPGLALLAGSGWALAATLALVLAGPALRPPPAESVPMLDDALADYRSHRDQVLPPLAGAPGELIQSVLGAAAQPLPLRDAALISSWATRIGGEPAVALAYRSGRYVVVQYLVSERVFFRQPRVRQSVAERGRFDARAGAERLVARPGIRSGQLLVGSPVALEQALPSRF